MGMRLYQVYNTVTLRYVCYILATVNLANLFLPYIIRLVRRTLFWDCCLCTLAWSLPLAYIPGPLWWEHLWLLSNFFLILFQSHTMMHRATSDFALRVTPGRAIMDARVKPVAATHQWSKRNCLKTHSNLWAGGSQQYLSKVGTNSPTSHLLGFKVSVCNVYSGQIAFFWNQYDSPKFIVTFK